MVWEQNIGNIKQEKRSITKAIYLLNYLISLFLKCNIFSDSLIKPGDAEMHFLLEIFQGLISTNIIPLLFLFYLKVITLERK